MVTKILEVYYICEYDGGMKDLWNYLDKAFVWCLRTARKFSIYIHQGVYTKKHVFLEKDNGTLKLRVLEHEEFLEEKEKQLKVFKNKNNEVEYIRHAMELALDGCNFVIFIKGEKFVQFWTSRKKLDYNFPVSKGNDNEKYFLATLGLLSDMDFVRRDLMDIHFSMFENDPKPYKYVIDRESPADRITGYFNGRVDQATEFTQRMFREVYKCDKEKLKINLG